MFDEFGMLTTGLVASAARRVDPVLMVDLEAAVAKARQIMTDLRIKLDNLDPEGHLNDAGKEHRKLEALRDARAALDHLETTSAPWAKTREGLRRDLEPRAPDGDPTVQAIEASEIRQVLLAEPDPLKRDLLFREAVESGDAATVYSVVKAPKILQRRLVSDPRLIEEGMAALGRSQVPKCSGPQ